MVDATKIGEAILYLEMNKIVWFEISYLKNKWHVTTCGENPLEMDIVTTGSTISEAVELAAEEMKKRDV